MKNKAVLYLSRATKDFSQEDINSLYQSSKASNKLFEISGFLCFKDNLFLQYIEGNAFSIDKVFERIKTDPRHKVLVILEDENIHHLRFNKWSMHLVNKNRIDDLEISFSLYEQLLMLDGHESISNNVQNLVWQGVGVVSKHHTDLYS